MKNIIFLVLLALLLASCKKEQVSEPISNSSDSFSNIDANLREYAHRFEEEANKRGLSFSEELSLLETHFENIPSNNVAGQCSWSSNSPYMVTIDIPFWNNAGPSQREWVVFHELGHCVLYRGHTEAQNNQGICLSIMASGTGSCQSLYNPNNRAYYLNELFNTPN